MNEQIYNFNMDNLNLYGEVFSELDDIPKSYDYKTIYKLRIDSLAGLKHDDILVKALNNINEQSFLRVYTNNFEISKITIEKPLIKCLIIFCPEFLINEINKNFNNAYDTKKLNNIYGVRDFDVGRFSIMKDIGENEYSEVINLFKNIYDM